MKAFFESIQDLFVDGILLPYDFFRFMDSWALSNIVNWFFMIIGATAFVYWMLQLKKHASNGEEDKSSTSHSYL